MSEIEKAIEQLKKDGYSDSEIKIAIDNLRNEKPSNITMEELFKDVL